jgi:hypothetical protein
MPPTGPLRYRRQQSVLRVEDAMKQRPYPCRRRHLPVVAFLACVSWLWSLAPASADQTLGIAIELSPQGNVVENELRFIITDKYLIVDTLRDWDLGSNGNPSTSRAMIFDKSGGDWKCQVFQKKDKVRTCVAIRVINSGRFLIDYSQEIDDGDGIGYFRDQLQYFLNVTTVGCQLELVSVRYKHGFNEKETITTDYGNNRSSCHLH